MHFFGSALFLIFYAFVGYGLVLFVLVRLRRIFRGKRSIPSATEIELPTCTLIVAAYNEEAYTEAKIKNTLALNYPKDKVQFLFITDGSTDKTPEIISKYSRNKIDAFVSKAWQNCSRAARCSSRKTDVMVFTDANTFLNTDALINLCRHYANPKVGAVAGENVCISMRHRMLRQERAFTGSTNQSSKLGILN